MGNSGQGSVEYMVIMAAVLVIALIVISISSSFTGWGRDLTKTEIDTYWKTQPHPLRIIEMQGYHYKLNNPNNGEIALLIWNVDNKPVKLRNILLGDAGTLAIYFNHSEDGSLSAMREGYGGLNYRANPNVSIEMPPSGLILLFIRGNTTSKFCSALANSRSYRLNLSLQYDTPYFEDVIFTGTKPIMGDCTDI